MKGDTLNIEETVNGWTVEECATAFATMMDREDAGIASDFVTTEDEQIVATVLVVRFGEVFVTSDPNVLEWPLQLCPLPEETPVEIIN